MSAYNDKQIKSTGFIETFVSGTSENMICNNEEIKYRQN